MKRKERRERGGRERWSEEERKEGEKGWRDREKGEKWGNQEEKGKREKEGRERGRGGRKRGRGEVHYFRSMTTSTPFLVNKECRPSFLTQEEMQTGDGCTCRRRLRITIHRQWGRPLRKLQVKEDT